MLYGKKSVLRRGSVCDKDRAGVEVGGMQGLAERTYRHASKMVFP